MKDVGYWLEDSLRGLHYIYRLFNGPQCARFASCIRLLCGFFDFFLKHWLSGWQCSPFTELTTNCCIVSQYFIFGRFVVYELIHFQPSCFVSSACIYKRMLECCISMCTVLRVEWISPVQMSVPAFQRGCVVYIRIGVAIALFSWCTDLLSQTSSRERFTQ